MRRPSVALLEERINYDGSQLRPHWIYNQTGIVGDAVVAFRGACCVKGANVVDVTDARAGRAVVAKEMLHFIAEHFGAGLLEAPLLQRLLVFCCFEALFARQVAGLVRRGDDLFVGAAKLSVSVATVSPVSALIHFGLNIDKTGCPVNAATLPEIGVPPDELARDVLRRYADEVGDVLDSAATVSPVTPRGAPPTP